MGEKQNFIYSIVEPGLPFEVFGTFGTAFIKTIVSNLDREDRDSYSFRVSLRKSTKFIYH